MAQHRRLPRKATTGCFNEAGPQPFPPGAICPPPIQPQCRDLMRGAPRARCKLFGICLTVAARTGRDGSAHTSIHADGALLRSTQDITARHLLQTEMPRRFTATLSPILDPFAQYRALQAAHNRCCARWLKTTSAFANRQRRPKQRPRSPLLHARPSEHRSTAGKRRRNRPPWVGGGGARVFFSGKLRASACLSRPPPQRSWPETGPKTSSARVTPPAPLRVLSPIAASALQIVSRDQIGLLFTATTATGDCNSCAIIHMLARLRSGRIHSRKPPAARPCAPLCARHHRCALKSSCPGAFNQVKVYRPAISQCASPARFDRPTGFSFGQPVRFPFAVQRLAPTPVLHVHMAVTIHKRCHGAAIVPSAQRYQAIPHGDCAGISSHNFRLMDARDGTGTGPAQPSLSGFR